LLEDRFVELEGVEPDGGRVRIVGPLGISRVARTRVVATDEPSNLRGTAEIGAGTRATVRWQIEPVAGGSRVTLAAQVDRASALDCALLALGGRWWLRRIFQSAAERLDAVLAPVPSTL
jgi:hypothetical protein